MRRCSVFPYSTLRHLDGRCMFPFCTVCQLWLLLPVQTRHSRHGTPKSSESRTDTCPKPAMAPPNPLMSYLHNSSGTPILSESRTPKSPLYMWSCSAFLAKQDGSGAHLVVYLPFLGISQCIICLGDFLELCFRSGIVLHTTRPHESHGPEIPSRMAPVTSVAHPGGLRILPTHHRWNNHNHRKATGAQDPTQHL
jgi:hypothetical protein